MNDKKLLSLQSTLPLKKYKNTGKTVEDIITEDIQYIKWVMNNVDWIIFTDDVEELMWKIAESNGDTDEY